MIFHLRTPFCPPLPAASSSVFFCNFFECPCPLDVIPINQKRILVMVDRTDPAHVRSAGADSPTEGARWPHVPNVICLPLYMILSTVKKQDTFFINL